MMSQTTISINYLLINQFDIIIYLSIISMFIGFLNGLKENIDNDVAYASFAFFYNIVKESFIAALSVPFVFFLLVVFFDPFIFGVLFSASDKPAQYLENIVYALFALLFSRELMKFETWLSLVKFASIVVEKLILSWRK